MRDGGGENALAPRLVMIFGATRLVSH